MCCYDIVPALPTLVQKRQTQSKTHCASILIAFSVFGFVLHSQNQNTKNEKEVAESEGEEQKIVTQKRGKRTKKQQ